MPSTAITTFTDILYFPTVELIQNTPPILIGYEPADLTVQACTPPQKRSRVGSFFSHRCLVSPKNFPQRKSGFCRRYSH